MTIEAVVFDFGGVFTPSPFAGMQRWFSAHGIDPDRGVRAIFGAYDEDTDHPWHRLERGELALTPALEQIGALAAEQGLRFDLLELFHGASWAVLLRRDLVQRVRRLRADGYRTALLTNNIAEFSAGWRAMLPVDELFEVVIDSSEVGLRKPDPRIFEMLLRKLGLAANRVVFLDDAPGNVEAARRVGMHAILVPDDHAGALEELDRLLACRGRQAAPNHPEGAAG